METIEYRVRPVTRYVVTRYEANIPDADGSGASSSCSSVIGEYDNQEMAYEVGYALAKAEHDRLGWLPGDERIKYPQRADIVASRLGITVPGLSIIPPL